MTFHEILNFQLFTIGNTEVSVATLLTLGIIFVATFWFSWIAQRAVARLLAVGRVTDKGSVGVARRVVHYAVLAIGAGVALQTLGINLAGLFAAGALFAVGLGFAAQNIFENFASGLILLAERTIKPGDILEVNGETVEVLNMGFRSTVVRTRDEEDVILPNSTLVQNSVTNYTLRDRLYRLRAQVGVTYSSDMKRVLEVLTETAASVPWRISGQDPVVLLTAFGSSSVDFEVSVWVDDPWLVPRRRSDLYQAIWWALKDAGIVIAFPQLDVHFDPEFIRSQGRGASDEDGPANGPMEPPGE